MPSSTYVPLASVTLGSSVSSVTFSSIPNTYGDLIIIYNGTVSTGNDFYLTLNGDTTNTNYNYVRMAAAPSLDSQVGATREIGFARTGPTSIIFQIMDYSATNKHKITLSRTNGPADVLGAYGSRWANTEAVTSVGFSIQGGFNFLTGSTFSLYGISD
jgi:hypothetical protein